MKHNPLSAAPDPRLVYKEGVLMAVIRPANAQLALALGRKAKTQDDMNRVLLAQEYRYVGLAGSDGRLYEQRGVDLVDVGELAPGDSFVSYEMCLKSAGATAS